MDRFVIEGGRALNGDIKISGAKNAALPLLCAAILNDKEVIYENVPDLADIETTVKILKNLGIKTEHDKETKKISVNAASVESFEASYELVRTMRASVLVLGPLLARFGQAKVSLPGGCAIGARPVNLHLMALEKMGAKIDIEGGYIIAQCKKLKGAEVLFPSISVGATENTLMAAALADGKTILRNAAREPEIVDLARLLKSFGVTITGEGTDTIEVTGVQTLKPCRHRTIPDRIEAGTYAAAVAITGGRVRFPDVDPTLLGSVLEKIEETGVSVKKEKNSFEVSFDPKEKSLKPVNIVTKEFPGFPTDMQAQLMAALCFCKGDAAHEVSEISENIFENRFMHVPELNRLGANIQVQGPKAHVRGKGHFSLSGATVMATDLRASASLVLAGLGAKGETSVRRIYHLDRGYECMEKKLTALGASVRREKED